MSDPKLCSIDGCGKKVIGRGWCENHYRQNRKLGNAGTLRGAAVGEPAAFLEKAKAYEGDDCLFWPFNAGRPAINWNGKTKLVCRILCEHARGHAPVDAWQAAHSCGKGHLGCVTKKHLRWATPAENQADRVIHGTSNRGERCATAVLTWVKVRQIRAMIGSQTQRSIAKMFGVSEATISQIRTNTIWVE